jgi:16S rRNA (guanine527-N7)-methyltransferase
MLLKWRRINDLQLATDYNHVCSTHTMTILHSSYIKEVIGAYGFTPNPSQCDAIRSYISLLLRWNQRISLTRITDPEEILRFHFGESLFAISRVPIREGRLADVGSGAGFPGLALKIALPGLDLVLIESNLKKAAFLAEVCRDLGLKKAEVFRSRMKDISAPDKLYDYATARALGNHSALLKWASRHLASGGKLVLWLGEREAANLAGNEAWEWRKPVHIPGSERRFLVVGTPSSSDIAAK